MKFRTCLIGWLAVAALPALADNPLRPGKWEVDMKIDGKRVGDC